MRLNINGIPAASLLVTLMVSNGWSIAAPPAGDNVNAADDAFTKGQYRQAAVHYQRILSNEPDNAGYRMRLAESYEVSGQLDLAEEHAVRVLENNRRNSEALLMMGRIRGREDDWAGSKEYYEQAVKADKQNASAHLGLGQALMQLGDDKLADSAFAEYRRLTGIPAP